MRSSMNLGLCYLSLNQQDDAVKYLKKATELSPTWADAWSNLGVALDAKGDFVGAENAYKRALELNRNQNVALLNLGANLIRQNKGIEAVSVMEEAIKRTDSATTRTRYGHALSLARHYDDALHQYDLALKLDPRDYPRSTARLDADRALRAGLRTRRRHPRPGDRCVETEPGDLPQSTAGEKCDPTLERWQAVVIPSDLGRKSEITNLHEFARIGTNEEQETICMIREDSCRFVDIRDPLLPHRESV